MRDAVRQLASLGRLPDETSTQAEIDPRATLLDEIGRDRPSRAEISALIDVFPSDEGECFGLSWALLHIIESGPDWPVWDILETRKGWWIDLLRLRLRNAGLAQPSPQ